jgi:hypothetical protein
MPKNFILETGVMKLLSQVMFISNVNYVTMLGKLFYIDLLNILRIYFYMELKQNCTIQMPGSCSDVVSEKSFIYSVREN